MFKEYFRYLKMFKGRTKEKRMVISSFKCNYNLLLFSKLFMCATMLFLPTILFIILLNYTNESSKYDYYFAWVSCILLFVYSVLASLVILKHGNWMSNLFTRRLYRILYVLKGKAISRKDFRKLKKNDFGLYDAILKLECQGKCYNTCFRILKCLAKGSMTYVGVLRFDSKAGEPEYTMHVLYINNSWCYDTFCQRQMRVEYAEKHFFIKYYKTFSYEDIEHKEFDEFMREIVPEMLEWCKENDVDCWYGKK